MRRPLGATVGALLALLLMVGPTPSVSADRPDDAPDRRPEVNSGGSANELAPWQPARTGEPDDHYLDMGAVAALFRQCGLYDAERMFDGLYGHNPKFERGFYESGLVGGGPRPDACEELEGIWASGLGHPKSGFGPELRAVLMGERDPKLVACRLPYKSEPERLDRLVCLANDGKPLKESQVP